MKILEWNKATDAQKAQALARPAISETGDLCDSVSAIIRDVRLRGDTALRKHTKRFDKVDIEEFCVSEKKLKAALKQTDSKLVAAMKVAKQNIEKFHKAELPKSVVVETMKGVKCALVWRPIDKVGLYVPAGTSPLLSALMMQAIPAKIAGCCEIVICTPPQRDGKIHPTILAAAAMCGLTNVFAIGGAQAIAAMAYGTESVPKVDKIFGPGNAYVTKAKQIVSLDPRGAAIDIPAGPSEVMVIADKNARPDWVAADLLSQAEHDVSSQAILLTTSKTLAVKVIDHLKRQLQSLPRKSIADKSLAHGKIIIVSNIQKAINISNDYSPEHLIIHNEDAAMLVDQIRNAGSVFLGPLTPESAGDYACGTNHVLPTYGFAKKYGGVCVNSFLRNMTVQCLAQSGVKQIGNSVVELARAEGMDAHANAMLLRMEGVS